MSMEHDPFSLLIYLQKVLLFHSYVSFPGGINHSQMGDLLLFYPHWSYVMVSPKLWCFTYLL